MGLLKTIAFIIIFYYAFKFIMRLLAPRLAKKMMEKAAKNFEEQFNNPYYREEQPDRKKGETYIEKKPVDKPKTKTKNKEGDYVDFEEID